MSPPPGVLFDFSGTLFAIESAEESVAAALGPDLAHLAPRLAHLGAINGSTEPQELPAHLEHAWRTRDLSSEMHRAAYSGLARHAGLTDAQADALYERGVRPEAWHPYPDTVAVLQRLRDAGSHVAVVSNIGWDPRPVLAAAGVDGLVDALVLSDEVGAMKPDPAIFRVALDALGVPPADCVMVGDGRATDGGSEALGVRFVYVEPGRDRAPDTLLRAVGLA